MTYQEVWHSLSEEWKEYFCTTLNNMCKHIGETKYLVKDSLGNFYTVIVEVDEFVNIETNLFDTVRFIAPLTDEKKNCRDWFFDNPYCRYFMIPQTDELKEVFEVK